jgi:hypothetical protein
MPDTPYKSALVLTRRPTQTSSRLVGGENQIYTVTLSEAINDPIMAIVSLGRGSVSHHL